MQPEFRPLSLPQKIAGDDMNVKQTLFNYMSPPKTKIEHLTNNRERFNNSVIEGKKLRLFGIIFLIIGFSIIWYIKS